jgi:hypothetical protein
LAIIKCMTALVIFIIGNKD